MILNLRIRPKKDITAQCGAIHVAHDIQALRMNDKLIETKISQKEIDSLGNNAIAAQQHTQARMKQDNSAINKWNQKCWKHIDGKLNHIQQKTSH